MRKSKVFKEIFNAEELQLDKFSVDLVDLRKQMDVSTATWALDIYEKELNIKTDKSKPLEERRSVIKSKERGTGKVDAALIKIVADAFTNGGVDVHFDGKINIKFNSLLGIPSNIQDLENALDDIKPAHLRILYAFAYLFIADVEAMTIAQLEATTLDKFAGGDY